jgi:hypothetical protein
MKNLLILLYVTFCIVLMTIFDENINKQFAWFMGWIQCVILIHLTTYKKPTE